ncbi:MAG: hypothetical protein LBU23_08350 [Planctomycetota bacterium]|jgi:hypothetical protein|nr:hypothetical protein [Planctomycetota bacterium]MDR1520135.1 hypothetical protein [Planctomycetota bacterium]
MSTVGFSKTAAVVFGEGPKVAPMSFYSLYSFGLPLPRMFFGQAACFPGPAKNNLLAMQGVINFKGNRAAAGEIFLKANKEIGEVF